MRDRLIELIGTSGCVQTWDYYTDDFKKPNPIYELADHLLANGVIVPPVRVGDTVWQTDGVRLYESTVGEMTFTTRHTLWITEGVAFDERALGKTVFLTREDAERAILKRGDENA